jgi:penicillin amidase
VRPNWDGLLPVPGDGRFEWQGFMPDECHPREYNPARQWVGTANHMNLPAQFDHARHKTGFEFATPGRIQRITEVMDSREKHSLEDFARLQADVQCQAAKALVGVLRSLPPLDGNAGRARSLLCAWDLELSVESAAAALFEIWFRRYLIPAVMAAESPEDVIAAIEVPDTSRLVRRFTSHASLDEWTTTLEDAWAETCDLLGPDPERWAWGTLHQAMLRHPLSTLLGPDAARRLDIGPLPKSGSALTVNNNGYRAADFSVFHGVSWRMLADVGNWDGCRMINSPGQSGDPASPHYSDHFPLWAREEYVPMLFSRKAIESALERRIVLHPAS